MKHFSLIGHPLGHSMSPLIHDALFKLRNRSASYSLTDIPPSELADNSTLFHSLDGFNVTIPHKVNIIPFMDSLDKSAARYNSVNCVMRCDNKLIGFNTDCDGFLISTADYPLDKNVLLIGCGGVGRMMAIEIALHGGCLTLGIIPDAMDSAVRLKNEILSLVPDACVNISLISQINSSFNVVINATPVGMFPNSNACPVGDSIIESCSHVFDAVYNPVETLLIKKARQMGKIASGGAAMLVCQAVKAHQIWDGDSYSQSEILGIIKSVEDSINKNYNV